MLQPYIMCAETVGAFQRDRSVRSDKREWDLRVVCSGRALSKTRHTMPRMRAARLECTRMCTVGYHRASSQSDPSRASRGGGLDVQAFRTLGAYDSNH